MGGLIDLVQKVCESIIHDHDCDLWVTILGRVDVPDSERVTSDVAVPSTYLVGVHCKCSFELNYLKITITPVTLTLYIVQICHHVFLNILMALCKTAVSPIC